MDERLAACIAFPTADIAASGTLLKFFPGSPLSASYDSLIGYLGDRAEVVILCWFILAALLWLFRPNVLRRRKNLNKKFVFLAIACLAGVMIDNLATFYQFGFAWAALTDMMVVRGMAIRTLVYFLIFAGVVVGSYVVETRRLPDLTPPQRFGRD